MKFIMCNTIIGNRPIYIKVEDIVSFERMYYIIENKRFTCVENPKGNERNLVIGTKTIYVKTDQTCFIDLDKSFKTPL